MNELTPITLDESRRLVELEKTIEHGLKTFLEVGAALAEIRDKKLYRVEHSTFDRQAINKSQRGHDHQKLAQTVRPLECAP